MEYSKVKDAIDCIIKAVRKGNYKVSYNDPKFFSMINFNKFNSIFELTLSSYAALNRMNYNHLFIRHGKKEFITVGSFSTNGIEGFWNNSNA